MKKEVRERYCKFVEGALEYAYDELLELAEQIEMWDVLVNVEKLLDLETKLKCEGA